MSYEPCPECGARLFRDPVTRHSFECHLQCFSDQEIMEMQRDHEKGCPAHEHFFGFPCCCASIRQRRQDEEAARLEFPLYKVEAVGDAAIREEARNPKDIAGSNKVPMQLIPFGAMVGVLKAFAEGARKYGAFNWRDKPISRSIYYAAAIRHIAACLDGEDIDPESGDAKVHHIDAAIAGLLIERDALANGVNIDDRHKAGVTGDLIRAATKKS